MGHPLIFKWAPVARHRWCKSLVLRFYWSSLKAKLFSLLSPLNFPTTLFLPNLILYSYINKQISFPRLRHPCFEFPWIHRGWTSLFSMSTSNSCFLTCIQVSQEAGQVFWYFHLFQNFPHYLLSSSLNATHRIQQI